MGLFRFLSHDCYVLFQCARWRCVDAAQAGGVFVHGSSGSCYHCYPPVFHVTESSVSVSIRGDVLRPSGTCCRLTLGRRAMSCDHHSVPSTTRGCESEVCVDCFIGEGNVRSECFGHIVVIVIVTVGGKRWPWQ